MYCFFLANRRILSKDYAHWPRASPAAKMVLFVARATRMHSSGRGGAMPGVTAGFTAPGRRHVQDFRSLTFRFLVAIDVEGFSQRHMAEQARVQDDLEDAMRRATADTGLDLKRWYRQPRGDGELAVLPAGTDGLCLIAEYPRSLASAVAEINQSRKAGQRLRARLAIHHGAVAPGRLGPVGAAPVEISRLVDAESLRQQLRQRGNADIALIVSATVYNEIIQSRLSGLHPEIFRRVIIRAKGITYIGYLCQDIIIPPSDAHLDPARAARSII